MSTTQQIPQRAKSDFDSDDPATPDEFRSPSATPARTRNAVPQSTRKLPSKKVKEAARRAHLEAYAANLFEELNQAVFKGELPSSTKLNWNVRLTSTAGKAKWHK